jgi:hypothetical protein
MSELKTGRVIQIWHASKVKIRSGDSTRFLHLLKDAPEDVARFNGHGSCVLRIGDSLTFRESTDGDISGVTFDVPTPEFPEFEDSCLVEWHPQRTPFGCGYGFASRECDRHCRIYCRSDDVITEGQMTVGAWIKHSVEEQYDGRIKAAQISIYQN